MVLVLILYVGALLGLVMTFFFALSDGYEGRSAVRAYLSAMFCLACMWANWQIMSSMIQDNPTCETSTEVAD